MAKNEVTINKKSELARLRKEERALKGTVTQIEKAGKAASDTLKAVTGQIAALEKLTTDGAAAPAKAKKAKKAKAEKAEKPAKKAKKAKAEDFDDFDDLDD